MEQEPKIGDWCEFWDHEDNRTSVYGRLSDITVGGLWVDGTGRPWKYCRLHVVTTTWHKPCWAPRAALERVKRELEQTLQHVKEALGAFT